jgi:hypothetical protein
MKKGLFISLFFAVTLYAQNATAPPIPSADPWKPLQFLIGTWEAKTNGGSAGAISSGTYTFQMELRNHILSRRTAGAECKGPANFNCEHSDLLYIYPESPGGSLKAIFFDNEGHVIHYDVSAPNAHSAVLVSDPSQPGPQYRLSYELKGNELTGKFEMRVGGQAEFVTYLGWSGGKKSQ